MRRHPSMTTKAVNLASLAIAFNQEIGSAVQNFQNGTWFSNPQAALNELLAKSTGIHTDGSINSQETSISVLSKIGGFAFNKVSKFFIRRFKV